jgi:hypothetical protein
LAGDVVTQDVLASEHIVADPQQVRPQDGELKIAFRTFRK